MANKTGIIIGFIFGMGGFLVMFKLIFLDRIPPEDEVPPGIVVFVSILSGLLFAFAGHLIQKSLIRK